MKRPQLSQPMAGAANPEFFFRQGSSGAKTGSCELTPPAGAGSLATATFSRFTSNERSYRYQNKKRPQLGGRTLGPPLSPGLSRRSAGSDGLLRATLQVPRAADAGYDGRCKLQQTSAFCSLLGRPCHLFPLLLASQVGTHYSIWLFEMEYARWPRRTASRWGHFYFEPGPVARCRLNESLIPDCYPWPNRGNPPKPPRECETRRSQPGGFLHDAQFWNQTQLE
jgi:hypothetical protein